LVSRFSCVDFYARVLWPGAARGPADGRVAWWSISRQPLVDSAGAIVGTIGLVQEITMRKLPITEGRAV
jgi:hypothetical protein